MADESTLTPYLGKPVHKTSFRITKAGDGLSKSLEVEPIEYEPGQHVQVVLDCVVDAHSHKRLDGIEGYELIQTLVTETVTVLEHDVVTKALEEQAAANLAHEEERKRAREREKGVRRLPTPEELEADHREGEHDDVEVDGCPACLTVAHEAGLHEEFVDGCTDCQLEREAGDGSD